ncbi:MAG: thioesterase [Oscillospiraceae bacterium]|nr:thioesterase [Oscillospiraceae bacterium]
MPWTVNYYDCDAANLLKISAAMRYMQQTSSKHLETLGISPENLYRQGMVFLLSKMCIKVHRMPKTAEDIVIKTAATETRGARFAREFIMISKTGERLVSALSLWVLADTKSHKIIRPRDFTYPLPFMPPILEGAIEDVKIPKLSDNAEDTVKTSIQVRYSHMDLNRHVNNGVYADFICDALPCDKLLERGLSLFVVSFVSEARCGDIIEVLKSSLGDTEYLVSGRHGGGVSFESYVVLK